MHAMSQAVTHPSIGLLGLPYELLIDGILPLLALGDLVRLRGVAKELRAAVDDDVVWRRRIVSDFHFPLTNSARTSGWQTLYRGLAEPELYTWGDESHARLGVQLLPSPGDAPSVHFNRIGTHLSRFYQRTRLVPFPVKVAWKHADWYDGAIRIVRGTPLRHERPPPMAFDVVMMDLRFLEARGRRTDARGIDAGVPVEMHAGGWCFFALTHTGQVMAWGSSSASRETSGTEDLFRTPTLLDTCGRSAKQLSVGRQHAVAYMDDGTVFEWSNRWDRPAVHLQDSLLNQAAEISATATESTLRQVSAGWDFTAVLFDTKVLSSEQSAGRSSASKSSKSEVVIWKSAWTYANESVQWFQTSQSGAEGSEVQNGTSWPVRVATCTVPVLGETIKMIAAGDRFVLALTDEGAVYILELPEVRHRSGDPRVQADELRQSLVTNYVEWKRLPLFCDNLRASGWNAERTENVWDSAALQHLIDDRTKITHITAQFQSFAVYAPDAGKGNANDMVHAGGASEQKKLGSGVVILGNKQRPTEPIVMPELQGIDVIKVVHGDWHSGALTLDGRVLTWGAKSNGALGTWDAVPVPENAESLLSTATTLGGGGGGGIGPGWGAGGMMANRATGVFRRLMASRATQEEADSHASQEDTADQLDVQDVAAKHTPVGGTASAERMVRAEKQRFHFRRLPDNMKTPQSVRFGFPVLGERRDDTVVQESDDQETKFVFDIAFAGWHSGALAIDRRVLSAD